MEIEEGFIMSSTYARQFKALDIVIRFFLGSLVASAIFAISVIAWMVSRKDLPVLRGITKKSHYEDDFKREVELLM